MEQIENELDKIVWIEMTVVTHAMKRYVSQKMQFEAGLFVSLK